MCLCLCSAHVFVFSSCVCVRSYPDRSRALAAVFGAAEDVSRNQEFDRPATLHHISMGAPHDETTQHWNEKQISSLLSKLPKPRRYSDAAKDSRATADFAALMHTIRMLMQDPDRILPCKGGLGENTIGASRAAPENADEFWDADIKLVRKVPYWWCVEWLCDASSGHLSKAKIRFIVKRDPEDFEHVIFHCFQLPKKAVLPKPCRRRKVGSRTFTKRAHLVGNRLTILQKGIKDDGKVDWRGHGCYRFAWSPEGRAVDILHQTGNTVAIPDHVNILNEFQLRDNWSDRLADVHLDLKPPVTYTLADFFPERIGPNVDIAAQKPAEAHWLQLAEEANLEALAEETTARRGTIQASRTDLDDIKREKRKAATQKARTVRAQKRESNRNAKVIRLDTA